MSVVIRRFLRTQRKQPLLLSRYIDIFLVWMDTEEDLDQFLSDMNSFNPALQYTHQHSTSSVGFLDLTIYNSPLFSYTNILDTKTFQKHNNLYQYLHYTSCHPRAVYKSIITGELVRYVKINIMEVNYEVMKNLFKKRLLARGYPIKEHQLWSCTKTEHSFSQNLKPHHPNSTSTPIQASQTCTGELSYSTECDTSPTVHPVKTSNTKR